MFSKVYTCGLIGLEGYLIQVEADISNGIPSFEIVGLASTSVKEARERVKSSINNSGYKYPNKRITINLAPADTRKNGSGFDLPVALGILISDGILPQDALKEYMVIGELALDGSIRHCSGMLCKAIAARDLGFKKLIVPYDNYREVSVIKELEIYPIKTLREAIEHLKGFEPIEAMLQWNEFVPNQSLSHEDFSDVRGQKNAKRALEVAASGGHNILMIGSSGSGKTMLARRIPTILPELTFEESLEITKIYSVLGLMPQRDQIITERPFRSPHHTVSAVSLIGGGSNPKPGEVSLAHHGVLFLDELPEFPRRNLDVLRQPLEDGTANISRISNSVTYPCSFMLVAAANPCKCGNYGDPTRTCTCSYKDAENYLSRLSGPLMDRVDIHVQVPALKYSELDNEFVEESSQDIRQRVNNARKIQQERYKQVGVFCNAHLNGPLVREFCRLDNDGKRVLGKAFDRLNLSARSHDRILKVARTVADMDMSESINARHISEAIQYRALDRTMGV